MKKTSLIVSLLFGIIFCSHAQDFNKMINLEKYAAANAGLSRTAKGKKRVVFMGNSITENWVEIRKDFFDENNYIGRGISGQTSTQMLLRFRQDVINLNPKLVVINAGTNDIAEAGGRYDPQITLSNIKSMAELAESNGIKVILSSVLPAASIPWKKDVEYVADKIEILNTCIKAYANEKGFPYIDYYSEMKDKNRAMISGYSSDGVHPVAEGYEVMEKIAKPIIDATL